MAANHGWKPHLRVHFFHPWPPLSIESLQGLSIDCVLPEMPAQHRTCIVITVNR